jgi:hypothetical protein
MATPRVEIEGLNEMLRAISKMVGPQGSRELRQGAKQIAEKVALDARGRASTPQQRLAAPKGINAKSDRVPTIRVGGAARLASSTSRSRQPKAGDVIFGADFGSDRFRQFPAKVSGGRLVFKAVESNRRYIANEYFDRIEEMWVDHYPGSGGGVTGF